MSPCLDNSLKWRSAVLKGGADVVENASFGSIDNEADTRLHASDRFERAILELTFKKKKKKYDGISAPQHTPEQ